MTTEDLVSKILFLQKTYASTYRFPINHVRYANLVEEGVVQKDDFENILIREELLEHVGHLPILGAALYPHIEHTGKFDLGGSLTMLSIHDICELITGDVLTLRMTAKDVEDMNKASKDLLPPFFYEYYRKFEANTSLEAKYAKSLDKLSPLFNDLADAKLNKRRSLHYKFGVTDVVEKVRPYVEWDSVLLSIFDYWAERMR